MKAFEYFRGFLTLSYFNSAFLVHHTYRLDWSLVSKMISLTASLLLLRMMLATLRFQVFDLKIGEESNINRAYRLDLTAFTRWVKLIVVHFVDAIAAIVFCCNDSRRTSIRKHLGGWAIL